MTVWMTVTVKVQICCSKQKNGTKYKTRQVPRIIKYVKCNKKKNPGNYFREQLMFFVLWRNEQVLLTHMKLNITPYIQH